MISFGIAATIALSLAASLADGDSFAARGEWEAAARAYRAEYEARPGSYDAGFGLARSLAFSGKRAEAVAVYTALLERSPGNSDLLLGRGRVYTWMDRVPEAESDLVAVTTKSPSYADAWSALGDLYYWNDRHPEAVAAYTRLVELRPADAAGYIARGKAHRAAGTKDAARRDFEAARERGGTPTEIDALIASLEPRRANPDAVIPEGFLWSASLSGGITTFSPRRDDWSDYGLSIRRRFPRGSIAGEFLGADRFGSDGQAWALDGYVDLWNRAYANLRYQNSPPARNFPDDSWRAEIFQGFGRGWELSASYDHMNYGNGNTDLYGAGVGKYVGNYYLRFRTLIIPNTGFTNLSHRATARWYYGGNGDDYLELSGGWSRGGEQLSYRPYQVVKSRSESIGASVVKYLTPRWGFKLSGSYGDEENGYVERGLSGSLYTRW